MDWKSKIKSWSEQWKIPPPCFIFTEKELRKILATNRAWRAFKMGYPQLFSMDPFEDNDQELKEIFVNALAPFLCEDRVAGYCQGFFRQLENDASLLVINHKCINDHRVLRHEFLHVISSYFNLFNAASEEREASRAERRKGWDAFQLKKKSFRVRYKRAVKKLRRLRR